MSPLAAVAFAREQGVGTIVHVSCRDRSRLALQSQVVGAAALGAEAVLCMQGGSGGWHRTCGRHDRYAAHCERVGMERPAAAAAGGWGGRQALRRGRRPGAAALAAQDRRWGELLAVADDLRPWAPRAFLSAAEDILADVRFYASVALLRSERMAERACALPGVAIPQRALTQIGSGGGIELARELAAGVACISRVDALHVFPLGAEAATREVAADFRVARGVSAERLAGEP
jgi:methylenetetrahydrofolate reductase (NADPH)